MREAEKIMETIKVHLLEVAENNPKCKLSKDEIEKICDDHKDLLILWDGALAKVMTVNPTEDDCKQAEKYIKNALQLMRDMGISITPKAHGMEDHVVKQMAKVPGGIGNLVEHWIEKYHQEGYKFDMKYRNMPDEVAKAMVRARRDKIKNDPDVIRARKRVEEKFSGKRKRSTNVLEKEELETQEKTATRQRVLDKYESRK